MKRIETLWALADQGLVSGVNFATGLLLARFLGPEQFGVYALAYATILLLAAVQNPLVTAPMMVLGPAKSGLAADQYYGGLALLQGIGAAALALGILAGLLVFDALSPAWSGGALIWLVPLAALGFLVQDFLRRLLFSNGRPGMALVCDLISYLGQIVVLLVWAFKFTLDVNATFAILAVTSAVSIGFALAYFSLKTRFWNAAFGGLVSVARENWAFGKWLLGGTVTQWGVNQLSIYAVGAMLGVAQVGAIRATQNILGVVNIPLLALENFVPRRAALIFNEKGMAEMRAYLRWVAIAGILVLLLIVGLMTAFSAELLEFVYADQYRGSEPLVAYWGVYFLVTFFHRPLVYFLRVLSATQGIFVANIVGLVALLAVLFPLIKSAGAEGAMMAMIIAQLGVFGMLLWAGRNSSRTAV